MSNSAPTLPEALELQAAIDLVLKHGLRVQRVQGGKWCKPGELARAPKLTAQGLYKRLTQPDCPRAVRLAGLKGRTIAIWPTADLLAYLARPVDLAQVRDRS